jgi:hypothetical protein
LHSMLENSEKGYNMVKKACTMMHSLVDDWKSRPSTSRPGKPWWVVIPERISHMGKQISKYFATNTIEVEGYDYEADEV